MGRPARVQSMATRFTKDEAGLLSAAASKRGVAVRECAREVLLDAAQSTQMETALFTETVALRMLLNNVLRELAQRQGDDRQSLRPDHQRGSDLQHEAARDLLAQYQSANEGN